MIPQAGEHFKADPRCIVSRSDGLALRPPATATMDDTGLLGGLKRRIRKAHGQQQQPQVRRRDCPLQRLSNTMVSNATDCFLAPPFPGDIVLVSVSGGTRSDREEGDSSEGESLGSARVRPRSEPRPRSRPSSAGRQSGRTRIDADVDSHRSRRSSATTKQQKTRGKAAGTRADNPDNDKPRKLVVLTQAIVAVGPEVTVKPMPSEDHRRRRGGGSSSPSPRHQQQRGGPAATIGAMSVCEGQGDIAVAGCGKLQTLRLRPGQRRVVDFSRAVGWTSSVTCLTLAGAAGRTPGGARSSTGTKGAASPSAVATFVGPGTVYVQTQSLSGLRRLLLPKPGAGGPPHGHGGGVASRLLGAADGERGRAGSPSPRRGGVVGLSLKRGLAKRAKAGAKRVLLGLSFLALYAVVTALLLEGRDGLVKAPRHAVQVARSLTKVARRVAMILLRLAREELWSTGEGEAGGGGGGASLPEGNPIER